MNTIFNLHYYNVHSFYIIKLLDSPNFYPIISHNFHISHISDQFHTRSFHNNFPQFSFPPVSQFSPSQYLPSPPQQSLPLFFQCHYSPSHFNYSHNFPFLPNLLKHLPKFPLSGVPNSNNNTTLVLNMYLCDILHMSISNM